VNPSNLSDNPILATNSAGYSIQEGGTGLKRVSVSGHDVASWAARVTSTGGTTRIREPRERVIPSQTWSFASDVKVKGGATAQISVSFYNSSGAFLTWAGGGATSVDGRSWKRVAASLPIPTNAAVADTVVNVWNTASSASIKVTHHDIRAAALTPTPTPTPTPASTPTSITNMPPQAASLFYGSGAGASAYARPGGLVVAGRSNFQHQEFKDVSNAGGHVLIYLDPIIDNSYGRYHQMLHTSSQCGPAVARWPGSPKANDWGYLTDFRVGSALQSKLECVLELMVAENPHMAGWFADDLGSRSWFPGFSWDSFGSTNQQAYRDGAIALTKTFREVANRHGLIFMVNGTWGGGSVSSNGGGYPDASRHGNALADGGFVENHDGQIGYFGPYGCSTQWAAQSPVSQGKAFNYANTRTAGGRTEYVNSKCYAYVNQQTDYNTAAPTWGTFHPTGLPSRVMP